MNVTVKRVGDDVVRLRVESDLGEEVVSLDLEKYGSERAPNADQDYDVKLSLGGPRTVVLYADRLTVGSWSASSDWQGPEA